MNTNTLKSELAIQLGELLEPLEGKTIEIEEWLTRDRDRGYDRHFSIFNKFKFTVEKTMWQMSGGNYYLYGKEPIQYGFFTGELSSVTVEKKELVIIEQYEEKTERKTVLKIC
jgi:hypothetical protein